MDRPWPRAHYKRPKERRKIVDGTASFLLEGASEALAGKANEDGSWWWAKESRLIKLPTARIPGFRMQENNCVRKKGKEVAKRRKELI